MIEIKFVLYCYIIFICVATIATSINSTAKGSGYILAAALGILLYMIRKILKLIHKGA